jgi:hypothetical protein
MYGNLELFLHSNNGFHNVFVKNHQIQNISSFFNFSNNIDIYITKKN